MIRRALLPAAALLAALAACEDGSGPASTVPPTGTYTITLSHGTLPGHTPGTTVYTGPLVLATTSAERVTGTYTLQRTFTPSAGPPSHGTIPLAPIAPGTFDGEYYALDAAGNPGTLQIRFVPRGGTMACQASVRVQPAGGEAQTAPATCTIGYQG